MIAGSVTSVGGVPHPYIVRLTLTSREGPHGELLPGGPSLYLLLVNEETLLTITCRNSNQTEKVRFSCVKVFRPQ